MPERLPTDLRREYLKNDLTENNLTKDPLDLFRGWFNEAMDAGFLDPNAMTLATADKYGKPSARTVLLKKFDERGFIFYTNYNSRKANEIAENPFASLLFYWDKLERQVRIEGRLEKMSYEESDEYFQTRDYVSKLGAIASHQSRPLSSRFSLMRDVAKLMIKYPVKVPLPEYWGGYRLKHEKIEFWQGRKSRLHDRFLYTREKNGWKTERLYP